MTLAVILGALTGILGAGSKPAAVRALDVLVIGPVMIACAAGRLTGPGRLALAFLGGATIGFNGRNLLREEPT